MKKKLPLVQTKFSLTKMSKKSEKWFELKNFHLSQIDKYKNEIDQAAYKLYGLTNKGIQLVKSYFLITKDRSLFMTKKQPSPSLELGTRVLYGALTYLKEQGGKAPSKDIVIEIPKRVELDDWALARFEKSGYIRWQSLLYFVSIDCSKIGYIIKANGYWELTPTGDKALSLGDKGLMAAAKKEFKKWKSKQPKNVEEELEESFEEDSGNPIEELNKGFKQINIYLADELLEKLKTGEGEFFENAIIQLLLAMGYGWDLKKAGRQTKLINNGEIDGIIDKDRFGLEQIYIQAKRYPTGLVQSQDVDKFIEAITIQGVSKGVFLTTNRFTDVAKEKAEASSGKIKVILIDGEKLTQLMIEHNVGVAVMDTLEIKKIDSNFFGQDD